MATTKVTTNVIDMKDNTGGLTWVKGTTAQRTTTTIGDLRENTETYRAEIYTDQTGTAAWRNLKESAIDNSFTVNFLVVAGGGGGGQEAIDNVVFNTVNHMVIGFKKYSLCGASFQCVGVNDLI